MMDTRRPGLLNRLTSWLRPSPLDRIRQERQSIQEQLELHKLKADKQLLEASSSWDYWLSSYVDLLDRYRDGGRLAYPISQPTDKRYGGNYPFWTSETQLSLLRAQARLLCTMNSYAIGLLSGLTSYIVADGLIYRAMSDKSPKLAQQVQDVIEEFKTANCWSELEQELFWRSREDGEYFLRCYEQDEGSLIVRTVEPEQITKPPDADLSVYAFGIETDAEDVQQIYAYWIKYLADPQFHQDDPDDGAYGPIGEEVDASDIYHLKVNVKRTVKRGLTDFCFGTHDALRLAAKIQVNTAEGAAIQAAIAQIREHQSASVSQVQTFTNAQVDFTRTNPITGQGINYHQYEPGSIVDVPSSLKYVPPPGWAGGIAESYVALLQASLRAAGVRWNAPEWLGSADASNNNFASSLTAESPFVKTCLRWQSVYKYHFKRVIERAVLNAVRQERLPPDVLALVNIQCEAPSVEARNKLEEAQANQIRVTGGWKSRQTVMQEEGLEVEQEMDNIDEWNERMGQPGMGLELPPEEGGGGAGADIGGGAQGGQVVGDSGLRATVGGLNAIAGLQADFYAGKVPREAAIANARLLFNFSPEEAASLFPNIAPEKLTPDAAEPEGGRADNANPFESRRPVSEGQEVHGSLCPVCAEVRWQENGLTWCACSGR